MKNTTSLLSYALLVFGLSLLACGGDAEPEPSEAATAVVATDTLPAEPTPAPLAAGSKLTAWVDGLFVRAQPEKSGTIVAQVRSNAPLEFTGKRSDSEETIVLRGMAFSEPWLEVRTEDGQEGWVFGGAVQRPGETKGTGYQSESSFDYPKFGSFDLSGWESEPAYESGGGDAATTIQVFSNGDRRLAVKRTDLGDRGYERLYTLTTAGGKLLKTRSFIVTTDPEPGITETVTDYANDPPRVYTRRQKLSQHFAQLNGRPEIATGDWKEGSE